MVKFGQFAKALPPIIVTVSGIVIVSIPGQFINRLAGILVVPSAKFTVFKLVQAENGPHQPPSPELYTSSTLVKDFGRSMDVRLVQLWNALPLISAKSSLRLTDANAVQFSKALPSILVTRSGNVMDVKLVQSQKALPPMVVMFAGNVIETNPVTLLNKLAGMVVIFSDKLTVVKALQPENGPVHPPYEELYESSASVKVAGIVTVVRLVHFPNEAP